MKVGDQQEKSCRAGVHDRAKDPASAGNARADNYADKQSRCNDEEREHGSQERQIRIEGFSALQGGPGKQVKEQENPHH